MNKMVKKLKKYFFYHNFIYRNKENIFNNLVLKNISDDAKTWEEKIKNTKNSVSIHIRRGDYVSNEKTKRAHNICGLEYYKEAINIIFKVKKCKVILFSH